MCKRTLAMDIPPDITIFLCPILHDFCIKLVVVKEHIEVAIEKLV